MADRHGERVWRPATSAADRGNSLNEFLLVECASVSRNTKHSINLDASEGSASRPKFSLNAAAMTPESVTWEYSVQFVLIRSILNAMRSACTKHSSSTAFVAVSVPSRSNTTSFISEHRKHGKPPLPRKYPPDTP